MRVVAGLYRHRELLMPRGNKTRPSKDMVKEGFFSALSNKVENAIVLDLFSGSGSLGIEAISRGATCAYLIDSDKEAIRTIKQNLNNLKIANAYVYQLDYQIALERFKKQNLKFDLVLIDPPYKNNIYEEIILYLIDNNLLNNNACIVLESNRELTVKIKCTKIKHYKYGKTFITILWL